MFISWREKKELPNWYVQVHQNSLLCCTASEEADSQADCLPPNPPHPPPADIQAIKQALRPWWKQHSLELLRKSAARRWR